MLRFSASAAVVSLVSCLLSASIASAQGPQDHGRRSASEAPRISARPVEPDDAYMRGLDDVVGPEDLVPSPSDLQRAETAQSMSELPFVHPPNCDCCIYREPPVSRFRNGFYQGTSFSGGYLGNSSLGIAHYDAAVRFAVPLDGMDNVIIASPSFRHEMLDSDVLADLPDDLYVTGVNFTWLKTISDSLRLTTMISPSIRSDFQSSEDAFRLFGLALVTYEWIPDRLDASFGVVYLDRDDIPILPAIGFTWTPKPWWRIDANFPRPRIARRIDKCGSESESWIYTGVALGGNTYAVERADGSDDILNLRDYQWIFGWEHLRSGGRGLFVEAGAAFGRSLEYERDQLEVDFRDSLFIRGGLTL